MNIRAGPAPTSRSTAAAIAFPRRRRSCVCIDGSEPGYIERGDRDRGWRRTSPADEARRQPAGAVGDPELHQSRTTSRSSPAGRRPCTASPATTSSIRRARQEVMMNDPRFLRAPTIMKAFHDAGAKVAVVTAKDKLRTLLGHGLDMASGRAIAFSSEKADKATMAENGIDDVLARRRHAAAGRLFGRAVGVRLRGRRQAPEARPAGPDVSLDHRLRAAQGRAGLGDRERLLRHDRPLCRRSSTQLGCVLVLTADHGMNDKHLPNGEPDVIYLQDLFDELARQGQGAGDPADHRSLRRPSRRARLLRHGLSAGGRGPRGR